jgi:hypothetical protein
MLLVAALALGFWLAVPAWRIWRDPGRGTLSHLWRRPDGGYLFSAHPVGFWARYRHDLLGLPWACPDPICRDNRANCVEIDSGRSVPEILRAHPEALMGPPR